VCGANAFGRARIITFDDLPGQNKVITGEYPAGLVNWGLDDWWHSAPVGQLTTKSLRLNGDNVPAPTDGVFSFVVPTKLLQLKVYNSGSSAVTVLLQCAGNSPIERRLEAGQLATIDTDWMQPCANVRIHTTDGLSTNFDDIAVEPIELTAPRSLVTFNDRPGQDQTLNGFYPSGLLNWGTGQWRHSAPSGAFTTKHASMTVGRTSATIGLPVSKKLVSLQVHYGGAALTTLSVLCGNLPTVVAELAAGDTYTLVTGWPTPCGQISVLSPAGGGVKLDNLLLE